MGTAVVSTEVPVKSENVVYERYSKVTMSEDQTKVVDTEVALLTNAKDDERKLLTDKGYKLEFTQTVRVDKAGTWDGCASIISDEDERVIVWNRGLQSKLNQKLNSKFRETNEDGTATFQSTEEVFDPSELVNEATQRKNLSPIEKAFKGLEKSGVSAEAIAAAMAAIQAAQAGSQGQ
ncbi:MAG TPA: hypothetical protein VGF75_02615 [Candidatus Saccharimonadales bacterium]|jgi:hypothetical protein